MRGLESKVAIVAGGGRGIGAETARRLASEGARVVIGDIMEDWAKQTATSITEAGGKALGVVDQALRLADLAREAGLDGIVCSGHEVGEIHRRWKNGFFVVPGLRPAEAGNGNNADQKRIVTPRQARDGGASVLVIGRPISRAEDPVAAARAIEATL